MRHSIFILLVAAMGGCRESLERNVQRSVSEEHSSVSRHSDSTHPDARWRTAASASGFTTSRGTQTRIDHARSGSSNTEKNATTCAADNRPNRADRAVRAALIWLTKTSRTTEVGACKIIRNTALTSLARVRVIFWPMPERPRLAL